MWKLIKIRADYEGWWLFDDWTERIQDVKQFDTYEAFINAYKRTIHTAMQHYDNYILGKYNMYAFYNNCDLNYCEDCNEDLQIFYSYITLKNEQIFYNLPVID
ncbi:DUF1033 family protein [Staphylococcus canis]|uniref:DUF1033 family protein n=1 Tax=Staphylococcus canis TaxID=2724942 RepID=A0ABS0TCH9_9STAP|nr:DUF1033 family protein [Staphylococcus canis]MBI5975448.1 DUF1033 family protein [Staphylococcus canis]